MKRYKDLISEGRPSQRHPLEGHDYHKKTDAELTYIAKDAHKAAEAMKGHNEKAENKYRDQANDSATVRYWRQKNGMPDWYKKKYGHIKEEVEQIDEDMKSAAKELTDYADKHGGMDKADFHKAAKHMAAGDHKSLHKHIQKLDSDPRDKILTTLHKHGNDIKRYGYSTEEVEINEMDKSQPSSSRGAEGHPIGKKAKPITYDKAKKDAYGALKQSLNKKYEKVKEEVEIEEDWQKVNKADKTDGLSQKAVDAYRRENPGSKLKTAVTEKNPTGKRAARRKSFCSRMGGMKKRLTKAENARDPDSPINKALRRWRC